MKRPLPSVVNDATSPWLFSTTNVAFANGIDAASPSLAGPGLAGLTVIVPSIPDSPPDEVCPVQAHAAVKTSPKMTESVWILTDKSIHHEGNEQGN